VPAGRYRVHFGLDGTTVGQFTMAGNSAAVGPGVRAPFDVEVSHGGGPLTLSATAVGSIWIGEARIENVH